MEGWDRPENLRLYDVLQETPSKADRWAGTIAYSVDVEEWRSSEFYCQATAEADEESGDGVGMDGDEAAH